MKTKLASTISTLAANSLAEANWALDNGVAKKTAEYRSEKTPFIPHSLPHPYLQS